MPATRLARRGDTVSYRNTRGETMNMTVVADTKAIGQPSTSTSTTGGTLAAATYSYRVTAVVAGTETAPSPAKTQVTTGTTSTVTVDFTSVAVPNATSHKVYGRTGAGELLMATVTMPTKTFIDDGSLTPAGALPTDTGAVTLKSGPGMPNKTGILPATAAKQTNRYYNR